MKAEKRLKYLAAFLWAYMIISFFLGVITNAGVPFFWLILIVYPSIGLYLLAKWLWT